MRYFRNISYPDQISAQRASHPDYKLEPATLALPSWPPSGYNALWVRKDGSVIRPWNSPPVAPLLDYYEEVFIFDPDLQMDEGL